MTAPPDAPGGDRAPAPGTGAAEDLTRLAVALERAASWVRRTTAPAEWNLVALSTLDALDTAGPQRVSDLVARESISQPGMTGLVARLEAAGLVTRGPDPRDGRATLVAATEEGSAYIRMRHRLRAGAVAAHLEALSAAERHALLAAVPALTRLAELAPDTHDATRRSRTEEGS
ncbi:MarR family winged helix-turn-helix transcriptional regulator [Pseudonocardia benzenivorans]|uniref:Regulatory protein MarR n=2 Tax=Pseudonocardia TaxID=1847 RepID=F4CRG9_PSEUX|nr:MarR family transcriptional regulator [Pseudonocardia dioxanivorans]AEA26177.1 regulatory protein MarR [Pseudonocardia dioxanivorans CB1190]GJF02963.1 hypothetical protein PSD17_19240 [Pseudonocardia sp. D17]